jgi:hypothetical protein
VFGDVVVNICVLHFDASAAAGDVSVPQPSLIPQPLLGSCTEFSLRRWFSRTHGITAFLRNIHYLDVQSISPPHQRPFPNLCDKFVYVFLTLQPIEVKHISFVRAYFAFYLFFAVLPTAALVGYFKRSIVWSSVRYTVSNGRIAKVLSGCHILFFQVERHLPDGSVVTRDADESLAETAERHRQLSSSIAKRR